MQKTVVITGTNRGIGLAFSRCYKAAGDSVIAVCRQSSPALEALEVEVVEGINVAKAEDVNTLAKGLASRPIDILINNAGILSGACERFMIHPACSIYAARFCLVTRWRSPLWAREMPRDTDCARPNDWGRDWRGRNPLPARPV